MNKLVERITEFLMRWCEKRGRILKITGTAGPDDVYLIRYYVVKSKWFNIFIHQFLRSDRDDLHDHPWDFCTYLVRGAYTERKWSPELQRVTETRRIVKWDKRYTKNRFVCRKATDQHQVVVDEDLKESQKDRAALTIFVSGPTKREWGFVKEEYVQVMKGSSFNAYRGPIRRWVPWREYLGLPPDTPGRG